MSSNISAYWAELDGSMSMRRRAANAANIEAYFPALVLPPAMSGTTMYEGLVAANRLLIQADATTPLSTSDIVDTASLPLGENVPDH